MSETRIVAGLEIAQDKRYPGNRVREEPDDHSWRLERTVQVSSTALAVRDLSMHKCICRSNGRLVWTLPPNHHGLKMGLY